jgi:hypothetical protein
MYSIGIAEAPRADLLTTLARAHNFSHAALAANRAGRLAPEQIAALRRRALGSLLLGASIVGGALLFAVAVGMVEGRQILGQMLLFSGIIALAGSRTLALGFKRLSDARSGTVLALEGAVDKRSGMDADGAGNTTLMHYFQIGQEAFRVSAAAYRALPAGATCRLYYSPAGKELLSIEPAVMLEA